MGQLQAAKYIDTCNWSPQGREEERDKRTPKIEEIMAKIFQKLMQTGNLQIQETQQILSARNMKKIISRHIILKLLKVSDKEKILKAVREKRHITY